MPVFNSQELLQTLTQTVREGIKTIEFWQTQESALLHEAGRDNSWSVVQHLYHLNFYASFYTAAIESCLDKANSRPQPSFRTGWLGNYFTEIIGPAAAEQPLKMKMKSPTNAQPPASNTLNTTVQFDEFIAHQNRLLFLLQKAQQVDLGAHRVATSLSKFVRLKLGDTFRFVIAHQERHFQHIERAKNAMIGMTE